MHPRDLLNLARTSKPVRALLISRSAKPFWKASIAGVEGLPKCPPYLSEPAFVNLLYFSHCHVSHDSVPRAFHLPGPLLISPS